VDQQEGSEVPSCTGPSGVRCHLHRLYRCCTAVAACTAHQVAALRSELSASSLVASRLQEEREAARLQVSLGGGGGGHRQRGEGETALADSQQVGRPPWEGRGGRQ
jgi:hypothetical protein